MQLLKRIVLIYFISWVIHPCFSFSQEDVHFGTIFVEDIEYENSENNENINHLTDQSQQQQQLETLYNKEIGFENKKIKKMNLTPRSPSSSLKKKDDGLTKKVGVITNNELPKQIVYFLELRSFTGNESKPIFIKPNPTSKFLLQLQPGEMIKLTDTPSQYIHKMRMDRDNQGLWKKIKNREQDVQSAHIYYDWRNFETITSHDFPVELDILVPYGRNSIPVFKKPGSWTWKDCGLSEDLCINNIDLHTKAYLFDSTIIDTRLSPKAESKFQLFYKIGYKIKDKDGKIKHRVGWIPAKQAKRKISQLPKSLLATRSPNNFSTYESDEERIKRLKKYYIFDSNLSSENRVMNRWINSDPGQTTEVFFQNLAIDGLATVSSFHMEQDFLEEDFDQMGVAVGVGIYAPIFIDLEIQGKALVTVPASANENDIFQKSFLFRGEQWLMYTTPLSISGSPFKFGLGGYFLTMFTDDELFGFNSLVGFQFKGQFDSPGFWTSFRYGPTGADFSFSFENREIGTEIGIRLDPKRRYESWSIYGEFSDSSYISPGTENATKFQIMQIGIRKQF